MYGAQGKKWLWCALSSLLLLALLSLALLPETRSSKDRVLTVYCAASLRQPLEEAAAAFQRSHGITIRLDYGSSGAMETRLRQDIAYGLQLCDIFLPADEQFTQRCFTDGMVYEPLRLAQFKLVYACPKFSDSRFTRMTEVLTQHQEIVVCDRSAAAGAKTHALFMRSGHWQLLQEKHLRSAATVVEAAGWIRDSGIIQGGFIWNTTALQHDLVSHEIEELADSTTTITAAISQGSLNRDLATQFIQFLQAKDGGLRYFLNHHFVPLSASRDKIDGRLLARHQGVGV